MASFPRFIVFAALLGLFVAAPRLPAQNPLNLTPGVAATVTLGQIATLANFNTSLATSDISYSNTDLVTRTYNVRLPSGFDVNGTTKKYGLVTYIDAGGGTFPASYAAALDAHDVIWIGGNNINNDQFTNLRRGVAIMGAFRMVELYKIDPNRIYACGLSGGGRVASDMAYLRSDFFHGFIGRVGSSIPGIIPGFQTAGSNSNVGNYDADYEDMATQGVFSSLPSVVLPKYFRVVLMSQYGDFRRSENLAIYRFGHLNHGNTARMVMRPGGHSDEVGPSFTDALNFIYHPLRDVIWDRFENQNLGVNSDSAAGKIVAGTGFTALAGAVTETTYGYNSSSHGVLRLNGDGAAAESNDAFTWRDASGILLDARLRAETATGQNQQIGLHIVSAAAAGAPAARPGFHVYWCYGQPYRAEIVAADGSRKTLATWEHTATHPMNIASAGDKTFWNSSTAPDYAGRTLAFRGEDIRVVLNSVGFQLTFNRPAVNLVTAYSGKVVTATTDTVTTDPNETLPFLLQGFWSEVETALVNALPVGDYKLVLTNDAIVSGQATGNAVVDEIHLVGASGPQAAPPTLSATGGSAQNTLAWTPVPGALGYAVQRSDNPDGPFSTLVTLPQNNSAGYVDASATQPRAYYYKVAAIGDDGATGNFSPTVFGVPLFPISNFGFETPSQGTGTNAYSYNTANASWTFQALASPSGSGLTANATAFTSANNVAPQGTQVAFAQGQGVFYQTLTGLNPLSNYTLTYAAALRQSTGSVLQNWEIKLDRTVFSTVTTTGTVAANKPYTERTATFLATDTSHKLVFGGTVANVNATVFFDNLRLILQPPAAPVGLLAFGSAVPPGASLVWNQAFRDVTRYRVERSPAGQNLWALVSGTVSAVDSGFFDSTAIAGVSYDYRVQSVGPGGTSAFATVSITVPVLTPSQQWRLTYFGVSAATGDAADLADPDHDGAPNLLEYALGSIPTDAASIILPSVDLSPAPGSALRLTFLRVRPDVTYIVEASPDLAAWSAVPFAAPAVGDSATVEDPGTGPTRFLRLKVTAP